MLEGKGAILDVARRLSHVLVAGKIEGAVVGGVAVVLHGHVRTTLDVDVYTPVPADFAAALRADGFAFDAKVRQFSLGDVPVHLVTPDLVPDPPLGELVEIDGIRTVSLEGLISMKLRSGMSNMLRAQDMADVIGLIRRHHLGTEFAAKLDKPVRSEFRKLARAVAGGL